MFSDQPIEPVDEVELLVREEVDRLSPWVIPDVKVTEVG